MLKRSLALIAGSVCVGAYLESSLAAICIYLICMAFLDTGE
jgi:hypothetical protein